MTGSVMKATGGTEPAIREPETTVDHCETSYEVRVFLNNPTANASTLQSDGEVAAAWQGKELLRAVYAAVGMPAARAALERFSRWADSVGVVELSRLARTIRAWQAEILAWHVTDGCSNGPTEAVNLLIKRSSASDGFRNFGKYRLRLHCGVRWQTDRTATARSRPTLVA